MSGYVTGVSPVKQLKLKKNPKNQYYQPKKYFNFYLHGKDDTYREVCFSPQKHKLLADIAHSQENQGFIMKKYKLNEDTLDFMLTDYTTIT